MPRTRLAPSPTGALHLGNARTFLVNWALARQRDWRIVLRIEDLDGPRVKAHAAAEAINVLQWLGVDWDEGPYFQRCDLAPYRAALKSLSDQHAIYPCRCTRKEIEAAALSAPHGDDHELRYPSTCRPPDNPQTTSALPDATQPGVAWRLIVPAGMTHFRDQFAGEHAYDVQQATGDFLVATKEGLPSYQLAVVVDDARQGIDRIVRGDDLLGSTHRQRLLQQRLEIGPPPEYFHLPLVVGPDGRRLAKRHGDSRIAAYRAAGVSADRIVGLIAQWCGLGERRPMTTAEFLRRCDMNLIPRTPIVFHADDESWLRSP